MTEPTTASNQDNDESKKIFKSDCEDSFKKFDDFLKRKNLNIQTKDGSKVLYKGTEFLSRIPLSHSKCRR